MPATERLCRSRIKIRHLHNATPSDKNPSIEQMKIFKLVGTEQR